MVREQPIVEGFPMPGGIEASESKVHIKHDNPALGIVQRDAIPPKSNHTIYSKEDSRHVHELSKSILKTGAQN